MTLPPEEYPEYKATLEVRENAFTHYTLLVTAVLLCVLWTTGSIGGAWYLAHRIDEDASNGVDD